MNKIQLNKGSAIEPKRDKLQAVLRQKITSGEYEGKIPGERVLAEEHQVNVKTMNKAVSTLVEEGFLYREKGKGTFVSQRIKDIINIGVLLHPGQLSNYLFNQCMNGISAEAKKAGSNILFSALNEEESKSILRKMIKQEKVAGFLLLSIRGDEVLNTLKQRKVPFVLMHSDNENFNTCFVGNDDVKGGYLATERLLKLGHKKIGIVSAFLNPESRARIEGYKQALVDYGIDYKDKYLSLSKDYLYSKGAYEATKKLIRGKTGITALFVDTDKMAMGVYYAIQEEGLNVPGNIAIVGYDDQYFAKELMPPLTTIHQDFVKVGREAYKLLVKLIEGEEVKNRKKKLIPQLIVRESCGASLRTT